LRTYGSTIRLGKYGKTMQVNVYSLPSLLPADNISDTTAVVIDTLRATSALIYASAAGVRKIIPLLDIEEAKQLKRNGLNEHNRLNERNRLNECNGLNERNGLNETVLPENILLGGERNGVKIDGFDLGNSPQSYTSEIVAGKTLIFTTTNGTVAMNGVRFAKSILLAALVNSAAVVRQLSSEEKIIIVCAGTCGEETEEDLLTAGSIVFRLCESKINSKISVQLNETAEQVKELWKNTVLQNTVLQKEGAVSKTLLLEYLYQSTGGKNLLRIGLGADIEAAAQLDMFDIVPIL